MAETDPHADAHREPPSQGVFIGWLAIGLLVLMAVFTATVLGSAALSGFK